MISYFYEGIVYTKEMENIYKWIKKYEIPEDKIYFVYGNHNIDDWWNDISKSDIINKKLNFISYIWPLQYMPDYYRPIIDEYKNITKDLLPHERKIWDNVFETSENFLSASTLRRNKAFIRSIRRRCEKGFFI